MRITGQALNRLNVLKAIRRAGSISRTELPARTRLSGGTITHITSDLLRRGLILERREAATRRGRPRTTLEINPEGGIVIGASLQPGSLTTAFVDLLGNKLFATDVKGGAASTFAELGDGIARCLIEAIELSPFQPSEISRIGIAVPAIVDNLNGVVHRMITFAEEPFPLADHIERLLPIPVTIENDAVCRARAEHWFGRARELDSFTMIHVGLAIGSGQYAGGVPRSGANGFNPEIGHVKTVMAPDARRCFCGGLGCLSAYSSMFGILRHLDATAEIGFPNLSGLKTRMEEFVVRARAAEPRVMKELEIAGSHLGLAVANHINVSDPGHVLILFDHAEFAEWISPSFYAALRSSCLPEFLRNNSVILDVADEGWRWEGTAALALEQTFLIEPGASAPGAATQVGSLLGDEGADTRVAETALLRGR